MCTAVIYDTAMEHNKHALLAYHDQRLRMLKGIYGGYALPFVLNVPHIHLNVSVSGVDFLRRYDDLVKQLRDDLNKLISGEDDLGGNSVARISSKGPDVRRPAAGSGGSLRRGKSAADITSRPPASYYH